jgi:hypothetical protein
MANSRGTINFGNQQIEYRFLEELRSSNVAKLLTDLLRPGIYKGGLIQIKRLNEYKISISPLVAIIKNSNVDLDPYGEMSFVIRTREEIVLQLNGAGSYYIVMYYEYRTRVENYADFYYIMAERGERATKVPPNALVIGRVHIYSDNTYYIDYDERDWGLNENNQNLYVPRGVLYTNKLNIYDKVLTLNYDSDIYRNNKVEGTEGVVDIDNNIQMPSAGGVIIERGKRPSVSLLWDEKKKSWVIKDDKVDIDINEVIHYPCVKNRIITFTINDFDANNWGISVNPNQEFMVSGRIYNTNDFPFMAIIPKNTIRKYHIRFCIGKRNIYRGYEPPVEKGFYLVEDITSNLYSSDWSNLVINEYKYQKETNNFKDFLVLEISVNNPNANPLLGYVQFPTFYENRISMYSNDFIRIKREGNLLYWQLLSDDPNNVGDWRPFA